MKGLIIIVTAVLVESILAVCPDQDIFSPCSCHTESVDIGGSPAPLDSILCKNPGKDFELKNYFENLSEKLNGTDKQFYTFTLKESQIIEVPENVFADIKIYSIEFSNCLKLERLNAEAFIGNEFTVKFLATKTKLSNDVNDSLSNLIPAIRELTNLKMLSLPFNKITKLPGNFISSEGIALIDLHGNSLKSIPDFAFNGVPNLGLVDLSDNQLNHISTNAFAQQNADSDSSLIINLRNNQLTDHSFEAGSLSKISPNSKIDLSFNYGLSHLNQTIFKPYFEKNEVNFIVLNETPITCDCHLKWLLTEEYSESRIRDLKCEDGNDFWASKLSDLKNCNE